MECRAVNPTGSLWPAGARAALLLPGGGDALRGAGLVATVWENSQTFRVTHVRIIPCAKSDVDEDKVVSWSVTAISFF